jgi:hypothetical protein
VTGRSCSSFALFEPIGVMAVLKRSEETACLRNVVTASCVVLERLAPGGGVGCAGRVKQERPKTMMCCRTAGGKH